MIHDSFLYLKSFFNVARCSLFLLGFAVTTQVALAADWPEYRHDVARGGFTEENLDTDSLGQAWVHTTSQPPQRAWYGPAKWDAFSGVKDLRSMRNYDPVFHPIVVGDHVYFGSTADDSIHCLDLSTGETVWTFTTGGPIRIAPTWVDGKLYFGSDDGFAYCISEEGELIWQFKPSENHRKIINNGRLVSFWPCRTGVVVAEGTAYFACSLLPWKTSYLCAVDAESGEPTGEGRYVQSLEGMTMEGALVVSPNLIVSPQGRVPPRLFNRATGESKGALGGGGGTFVVLVADSQVIHGPGNKTGWLTPSNLPGADAESGDQIARFPSGNSIVMHGDHSYLITDTRIEAANWRNRESLWSVEESFPYELIVAGELVIVGGEGRVAAFSTENGEQVWSESVDGRAYGLAVASGRLVVSTDTGSIYCFEPGRPDSGSDPSIVDDTEASEGEPSVELAAGPFLQFDSATTAVVRWETNSPSPSILNYGPRDARNRNVQDDTLSTHHEVRLENLRQEYLYTYMIQTVEEGETATSKVYECDAFFNYSHPSLPEIAGIFAEDEQAAYREAAELILQQGGVNNGICVVLGSATGRLAYEIARQSDLYVLGIETDAEAVATSRAALMEADFYGRRVAILHVDSFDNLPLPLHFANLVVSERVLTGADLPISVAEVEQLLQPATGIAVLGSTQQFSSLAEADQITWQTVSGQPVEDAAQWSHMYGGANNAGYTGETLSGTSSTSEMEVQWMGRPGPRYQADRQGRKNAPLSVNGRLFLQGLHRIVALDSYNGSVLWSLETPTFLRFNIPRDSSNWCADNNYLYAVVEDRCWKIDAATGEVLTMHDVTVGPRDAWDYDWGYAARVDNLLLGSAVKSGSAFTGFWGRAGWFEGKSGDPVSKVCSDNLFAIDTETGDHRWTHSSGVILNSTITAADDHVYFLECRNEEICSAEGRRIGDEALWSDLFLVCLDLKSGEVAWEQSVEVEPGRVMVSLAHSEGKLVLVCNNVPGGQSLFHVYCYMADDGTSAWEEPATVQWGKSDHGKALSRPVIVDGTVYVRPSAIDLETGELTGVSMPHGGCGTYICTRNAFFFRSSNVTVWDPISGTSSQWDRLRPDCWLSTIPAGGMLLSPEGGGGCSCGHWMETSIGFIPAAIDRPRDEP